MKKEKTEKESKPIITRPTITVTHVEVTPEGRTERVLTGEELEEWKKAHGFNTDTENQSDTK